MTHQEARTDEALRDAFAARFRQAGEGVDCPCPEILWSSAREELDRAAEEDVLLHVGECGVCAAAWQMAKDLAEDSAEQQAPVPDRSFDRWRWLAVAAAVLVGLAFAIPMFVQMQDRTAPVFRTAEGDWLQPTFDVEEPLSRDECLLRWASGPSSRMY